MIRERKPTTMLLIIGGICITSRRSASTEYRQHKSIQKKRGMILRWNHPALCYIEIFPVCSPLVPAVRIAGMQRKLPVPSSAFPPKRKSVPCACAGFLLHFLSRHDKLPFAVCICTCEENEGLQREPLFAAGFPIGARSIPVGTRFCSAKSSVLYLCFRLTRERG